jgi:hypothetical protein
MSSPAPSIEVEDVAAWTRKNGGTSLQPPNAATPTAKQQQQQPSQTTSQHVARPSVSYRARPRTISSQTTTFLMKLSRLHLEWHIASTTALVYALRAVGNQSVKADKTLVTIDLPDPSCNQPRVVMVEREAPLKTILLDSIVSVTFDKGDSTRRIVRIVYWFDKNRQMRGPPTHPPSPMAATTATTVTPTVPSTAPAVVNIAASSTAKQFLLSLTFASHLDSRDFHHLLNYMLNYGCPTDPSALFRLSSGTPAEFVVLHAGLLEKKGKLTWSRRYARLFAGFRLVIYRSEKSHLPVNVLSLARGMGEQRMIAKAVGKDQIALDMPEQSTVAAASTNTEADATAPSTTPAATPTSTGSVEPAYFFRFENPRERDRWLAALQIEFDQPLKQLLRKPGSSTHNPDAVISPTSSSSKPTVSRAATTVPAGAMNPSSPAQISHSAHPLSPTSNLLSPLLSPQSTLSTTSSGMPTRRTPEPPSSSVSTPSSSSSANASISTPPPPIPTRPPPGAPILQHPVIQLPVPALGTTNTPSPTAGGSPNPSVTPTPPAGQNHSPQPPHTDRAVSPMPHTQHPTATPAQLIRATSGLPSSTASHHTAPLSKQDLALKSAEMAYTYYSQLLTLCSSPEVLRMSETDELIIPNDGSCGNVNLAQFSTRSTTSLPQAANPNLKERQKKEQAQQQAASAALSAPSSLSPIGGVTTTTTTNGNGTGVGTGGGSGSFEKATSEKEKEKSPVVPVATTTTTTTSSSPSFNPLTHQKVSVLGLLHKVQDQALYFPFLSYFRSQYSALLFWTTLPTVSVFQSNTPSISIFKLGSKKRGGLLSNLDLALRKYQMFMYCSSRQLKDAKLMCFEVDSNASTSSSQIGFAFPGFDSQVFDIGRFSILSPSQMFLGLENSFEDDEWNTALKASSVGKELMQSSADLTTLFESQDPEDQNRARALMHSAQLEVLHNIALAAHMRSRWAIEKQRLREGEVISFAEVLAQFSAPPAQEFNGDSNSVSESEGDSELFQYSRNHMQLEQWIDITYVYSPPRQVLLSHLKTRMDRFAAEQADQPTVVASMGNIAGFAPASITNQSTTGDSSASSLLGDKPAAASKDTQSSPQSSPRRHPHSAPQSNLEDDSILLTGLNPIHGSSATPLASYAPTRHFLFDAFHYLLFLRLLFDQRKTLLEQLENALHLWLAKYHRDSSKSKASVKYEYIIHLQSLAESEKKRILGAMNQLPSNEVMEGIVKVSGFETISYVY